MARFAMAAAVVAVAIGCAGEPDGGPSEPNRHFVATRMQLNRFDDGPGELLVRLIGAEDERCPSLDEPLEIRANGVAGEVIRYGGPSSDEPMFATCLEAELSVFDVPIGDQLLVEIDTPDLSLEVERNGEHRMWTESDIAAAMETRDSFMVSWLPEAAPAPLLSLYGVGRPLDEPVAVIEDSGPGWVRAHFEGAEPLESWHLIATSTMEGLALEPCGLDDSCLLDSRVDVIAP